MRGVRDSTWPFCLGAVQRPAVQPDPSAGSWVRALVSSARPVLRRQGHAGPRSHLQARRRPRQVRLGVYGLEDLSPASAQFAAEAGLTAFALMAAAAGVVDTYSDITGEKWKPYGAAGLPARHCRPADEAEIAAFGRGGPGGVAGPRLAAPQFPPRWPGVRPHATGRQDSGAVLRNWETATEARASRHRQKSARARRTDSMRKVSGLGASPPYRQFSRGQTVSDCSPRLLSP